MNPSALFFDFDGVILDSVDIKTEAMRHVFAAETPGHLERIIALHERHGGVSRYRKFEMIYNDILKRPLFKDDRAALGARFETFVRDRLLTCDEIAGARAACEFFFGRAPIFVVSGTPQDELVRIARQRDFALYFEELHGSPPDKTNIVRDILRRYALNAESCIFIGDAMTDRDAAEDCGMPFIGVVAPGRSNPFGEVYATIADLTDLTSAVATAAFRLRAEAPTP